MSMDSLEALDEAILKACLATYENHPEDVKAQRREALSRAMADLRDKDARRPPPPFPWGRKDPLGEGPGVGRSE